MKIWIDLSNSPHVNFFKPFIKDWKKEGHDIIITCRDFANTKELISQNGWDYNEIGTHAGKNLLKKVLYFPRRVWLLYRFLKKHKPDVAISHSSYYSPVAAFFWGIPSIYINDNEYAKGNFFAFCFASKVFFPEYLYNRFSRLRWLKKISFYPGIKEGIYLSQLSIPLNYNNKNRIYVRPEPWLAQYYNAKQFFLDKLLQECASMYQVCLLPRDNLQAQYYSSKLFNNITIFTQPLDLNTIVQDCALFIGAGGTMTRELALLGIPTISVYQERLLEVDKYLIKRGSMYHFRSLTFKDINQILKSYDGQFMQQDLLEKGAKAYDIIKKAVACYQ